MADDDSLLTNLAAGRSAPFDDILDADRLIIDRSDDQRANIADPPAFLGSQDRRRGDRVLHAENFCHGIGGAAKLSDAADGHRHLTLIDVVTADRHVAV